MILDESADDDERDRMCNRRSIILTSGDLQLGVHINLRIRHPHGADRHEIRISGNRHNGAVGVFGLVGDGNAETNGGNDVVTLQLACLSLVRHALVDHASREV